MYPLFSITPVVERRLYAAMRPRGAQDFAALRAAGIRGVLCLKESAHLFAEARDAGLLPIHVAIPDFAPPDPEALEECLAAIDERAPALVHCHAGLGRTGTVCAAWLMLRLGLSAAEAVRVMRRLRPGSVESPAQEAFLGSLDPRAAFAPPPGDEPLFAAERSRLLALIGP